MSATAADAATVCAVALGTFVLPWLAMRMLVPTLERSATGRAINYRGRQVALGLGLVWVFWSIGLISVGRVLELLDASLVAGENQPYSALPTAVPFVLVLGAFAFGFADDMFGTAGDRGFRGHLSALRTGRLTTGGLKLLGIGLLAAVTVRIDTLAGPGWKVAATWALEVLAISLTANLVNLLDLRPGRALKVFGLIAGLSALSFVFWGQWVFSIELAVALLGPVIAIWRFDLGERAMLGDAGANAMGALLGWVVASILPMTALAAYVAIVLALNLLSERISFSRVIEGNTLLSWLDGLGRMPVEPTANSADESAMTASSAKTSHHSETGDS